MKKLCRHNQRSRFNNGFYCEDCKTFFHKSSSTYRKDELLGNIWMSVHNIYLDTGSSIKELFDLRDEIGTRKNHDDDYEELIEKSIKILKKYHRDENSAMLRL